MTEAEALEVQSSEGKTFLLRFLPWFDTIDLIGYVPAWFRRGSGWGRWEECYRTEAEAVERMRKLIELKAIEDAEVLRAVPGQGMCKVLLHEWRAECPEVES